jgi:hypothetical protein
MRVGMFKRSVVVGAENARGERIGENRGAVEHLMCRAQAGSA